MSWHDELQSDLGPSLRNLPQDITSHIRPVAPARFGYKSGRCPTSATSKGDTKIPSFLLASRTPQVCVTARIHGAFWAARPI